MFQAADGDLQQAKWIEWAVPVVDVWRWVLMKAHLHKKALEED